MKWDWKAFVGVAISALLIWWVLRGVDLGEVWVEVRQARWGLLLAAVAVTTFGFVVRAIRWRLFLQPISPGTAFRSRFAAVNIGFAANNLLPARVGEFVRAWSISKLEPVPVSSAIGSLVVERFLDAIAIFVLLTVALLHPSFPVDATVGGQPIGGALVGVLGVMGAILFLLVALVIFPQGLVRLTGKLWSALPGRFGSTPAELLESFLEGLGALRNKQLFLRGLAWSLGFWAWNAVSFWLAFQAFGIEQGYVTALFVQAIIALGVAVPSAPGFFGTFHAAAVVGLQEVYGESAGATLAFAFGYHLGAFIPVTVLGLWYAGRLGFTLRDMGQAEDVVEQELDRASGGETAGGSRARSEVEDDL